MKICGKTGKTPEGAVLRCRESGSTLRFMIPPALTGGRVRFEGTPRLLERGVGIYEQLLGDKGIEIKKDSGGIEFFGALTAGEYVLRGDVSSQFITGLLFALPLLSGDSVIKILPPVESRAYIDITAAALGSFGIKIAEHEKNTFAVPGGQRYAAGDKTVEGDWSNAAALEAFNLIGGRVNVNGLNENSIQGDRVCLEYFRELTRPGAELDISNCPDLGPVLFALAAATGNGARFTGTRRLRIKESDRAAVMAQELEAFGIKTELHENSVTIKPGQYKQAAARAFVAQRPPHSHGADDTVQHDRRRYRRRPRRCARAIRITLTHLAPSVWRQNMKLDKNTKILILGLGLMGGSYAESLTSHGFEVGAVARRQETIDYALREGIIKHGRAEINPEYIRAV